MHYLLFYLIFDSWMANGAIKVATLAKINCIIYCYAFQSVFNRQNSDDCPVYKTFNSLVK